MIETKKELIDLHKKGEMEDRYIMSLSAWSGIIVVDLDEDHVFGYYYHPTGDEVKKDYFKVQVYSTTPKKGDSVPYFIVNNFRYYLREFMRLD
jgi:hypothetical protein